MNQPTTPDNLAKITSFFDNSSQVMSVLLGRWKDEKDYEDFAEFKKVFATLLPNGFELVSATKAPFGFKFSIGTEAVYFLGAKPTSVYWKRVG